MTSPMKVTRVTKGEPIPFGIHDVEHPEYGWARTVTLGQGSVAMANISLEGNGVALGMFNHKPMPIGTISKEESEKLDDIHNVDVMFVFTSTAAISAVESMLANAKIQLRRKSIP